MSRIGLLPIPIPAGVDLNVDGQLVTVKGPKGELSVNVSNLLTLTKEDGVLKVTREKADRDSRSQHGLARTLINNCVVGVTQGHAKTLDLVGVGFRATLEGGDLVLNVGFSHPVRMNAVEGIKYEIIADEKSRTQSITVSGIDKALVGQIAADIRKVRKPDPYKGRGVRYRGEVIKLKAGKRAAGAK